MSCRDGFTSNTQSSLRLLAGVQHCRTVARFVARALRHNVRCENMCFFFLPEGKPRESMSKEDREGVRCISACIPIPSPFDQCRLHADEYDSDDDDDDSDDEEMKQQKLKAQRAETERREKLLAMKDAGELNKGTMGNYQVDARASRC